MSGLGISAEPCVVVGAGQAGGRAVETLRTHGYAGKVVLIGDEPEVPYERPELSKGILSGAVRLDNIRIRPIDYYREARIDLRLGSGVVAIDRAEQRVRTRDGSSIPYSRLLLTTGARPRALRIPGASPGPDVLYLRSYDDAVRVSMRLSPGERIAVIGGGVIGLEVAAAARRRGCSVVVIEAGPQLMGRMVTAEVADYLARLHAHAGVKFLMRAQVAAVERSGTQLRVILADGEHISADSIIVGAGAVPNTELASLAGLMVDDGIVVDSFGRTSDAAIFSAGDATRHPNPLLKANIRLETWQNAQNQAIAVARNMMGFEEPYSDVPWAWTTQYDATVQVAGSVHDGDRQLMLASDSPDRFALVRIREGRVIGAVTVNMPREMRRLRKLISEFAHCEMLGHEWHRTHELASIGGTR